MPTMLLLSAAGVIPTIEPPDWPSIKTTSLPSSASGVVFDESIKKSHLSSLPAIDHGRGFGCNNGVFITPLPTLPFLSTSKLLIDSLLGDRVLPSITGGCKRLLVVLSVGVDIGVIVFDVSSLLSPTVICFFANGDLRPTTIERDELISKQIP